MASSGLQPVRLTKLGHNVLDTSENQFTENKRDLFFCKTPWLSSGFTTDISGVQLCWGHSNPLQVSTLGGKQGAGCTHHCPGGSLVLVELLCLVLGAPGAAQGSPGAETLVVMGVGK